MLIVDINGEEPITSQGVIDELNHHQTTRGKFRIKISLFRRENYQRTDTEDIRSIFNQVRPVVSLQYFLIPTPKNIGEALVRTQRPF